MIVDVPDWKHSFVMESVMEKFT